MRHLTALCLKLSAYLLIFGFTMPVLGRLALPKSIILAAVHCLLLWLADLIILPRYGRTSALGSDLAVLTVGSFLVLRAIGAVPRASGLLLAIFLALLFEAWFHYHLTENRLLEG